MKLRVVLIVCLFMISTMSSNVLSYTTFSDILKTKLRSNHSVANGNFKLSKKAAVKWVQSGSTEYYNSAANENPKWEFSERDTIIYDQQGRVVVRKYSQASSGWNLDDISYIDSTVFDGAFIKENWIIEYSDREWTYGSRITYDYLDGKKSVIITQYEWDKNTEDWKQLYKDSVAFLATINSFWEFDHVNMGNLRGAYGFEYVDSTWESVGYWEKVDNESSANTAVYSGKEQVDDILADIKSIYTFSSTDQNVQNLTHCEITYKDPVNGNSLSKSAIENQPNGNSLISEYDWDEEKSDWLCVSKNETRVDSYLNDTLTWNCTYDKGLSNWDTTVYYTKRIYDNNGNNIEFMESNSIRGLDIFPLKTINSFIQIDVPVVNKKAKTMIKSLSLTRENSKFIVKGNEITGMTIFNATGKKVLQMKQQAANTVKLDMVNQCPGLYIGRVKHSEGISTIRFAVY